jgi:hypothetical protein
MLAMAMTLLAMTLLAMTLLAMLAMPTMLPVAYCLRHIGDQEQHAMVARALISVQQEVLEQHGYKGEQGFAQASEADVGRGQ